MSHIMRETDFCLCRSASQLLRYWMVQSHFFLNLNFQAFSYFLWLYRPVCVRPGWKPRRLVFSCCGSYIKLKIGPCGYANYMYLLLWKDLKTFSYTIQVNLIITLSLRSIESDRVIRETCYNEVAYNRHMSCHMGKPTICICENKGADQLRGNREADQRLCCRYSDSTIPLLLKSEIQAYSSFLCLCSSVCVGPGRKPHCWFSYEAAHIVKQSFWEP